MKVVAVHRDALVVTSRMWQTTATALRSGSEAFLFDAPFFPDELEALPGVLESAGFHVDALFATHADFDHLLGRLAFPELPLGVGEPTVLRLRAEPGAAQRALREHDDEFYVARPSPLGLGQVQSLPVPGKLELGEEELELHPAEGHTADGTAVLAREKGILICGDYLSDVEIPMISPGGSAQAYRSTLERFRPLVEAAEVVVPGHGSPHDRDEALRILEEDLAYLDTRQVPKSRDTPEQRRIHARNLEALG